MRCRHLEQAEKEVTSDQALREITVARRVIEVLVREIVFDDPVEYTEALKAGIIKRCPNREETTPLTKKFWGKDSCTHSGYQGWCKNKNYRDKYSKKRKKTILLKKAS